MSNRPKFVVPSLEARTKALGSLSEESLLARTTYQIIQESLPVIPLPKPGDWLYSQEQNGQTYTQYLAAEHALISKQKSTIYLLPLQTSIPLSFVQRLQEYCQAFYYGVNVILLKHLDLTQTKINSRVKNGKIQYDINEIIEYINDMLPEDGFCLLAVCISDLFPGEGWNFVFGGACPIIRKGVFSFARYDHRFFQNVEYQLDYDVIMEDAVGVMVHEIGHMFNIEHCIFYSCIMNGANNLIEDRNNLLELCAVCLRKFQSNIKFDVIGRYEAVRKQLLKMKGNRTEKTLVLVNQILEKVEGSILPKN